jgi:hypothetical protein
VKTVIRDRRRIAKETALRTGATRKTSGDAADTAAVGWLAEGVRRACGKPHHVPAAALAGIVLGFEVSVDQLREAERTRREHEWRQRI